MIRNDPPRPLALYITRHMMMCDILNRQIIPDADAEGARINMICGICRMWNHDLARL
jgi:hypothetical protein